MKNYLRERGIQLNNGGKGKKKAELFDICKTAAARKQIQPADLLKTAKGDGGEITIK